MRAARRQRFVAAIGRGTAAEAVFPFGGRTVGDGAELARQAHAGDRAHVAGILAVLPVRIGEDGVALQRTQRNRERRSGRAARNADDAACDAGELRGEGQHHHAAERSADHRRELFDPSDANHFVAAARDVLDRQIGKVQPVRKPGGRIDRRGAGRTEAAAQRIHADDEVAVGVDGLAGADHLLPPAGRRICGEDAACAEGERPVNSSTALSRASLSSPQVS